MNKLSYKLLFAQLIFVVIAMFMYVGFPAYRSILWPLMAFGNMALIVVGIVRNQPRIWFAWSCMAIMGSIVAANDVYYFLIPNAKFPSIFDILTLITAPLFLYGLYVIVKSHSPEKSDRGTVIDASVFTLSLALVIWVYTVMPTSSESQLRLVGSLIGILCAAVTIRLLVIDSRTWAVRFLAAAFLCGSLASMLLTIKSAYHVEIGGFETGIILLVFMFYSFFAAAALHPSMRALDLPVKQVRSNGVRRLFLLAVAALAGPAILMIETIRGRAIIAAPPVAVFSAVTFLLVILRLYGLAREISQRDADLRMQKQRTEFIYLASHQLRTPAAIVKDNLSLIIDGYLGKVPAKQLAELKETYKQNDQELSLVNAILDTIQFENNDELKPKSADIAELVRVAIEEIQPLATKRMQKITTQLQPEVAEVDELKIAKVINVLLNNAVKYTPEKGQIELILSGNNREVVLSIKDNGIGMSDEDIKNLFKQFTRGSNAAKIDMTGAGVGLSIAKKLIDSHGGQINVKSAVDTGSIFTVVIPRVYLKR